MALDRFELLELRRDDAGIQTFHARENSTARPVQVHLFTQGNTPDAITLLSRLDRLPDTERRRVIDRGIAQNHPYVVTDRLAGFASFREWIDIKASPPSLDLQFHALFDHAVAEEPHPQQQPPPVQQPPDAPPPQPLATKFMAVALGIAAALAFLAVAIAVFAFHLW